MQRKRKARELLGNVFELGHTTPTQDRIRRQLCNANVNAVTTDQSSIVAHVENNQCPIKTNSFCSVRLSPRPVFRPAHQGLLQLKNQLKPKNTDVNESEVGSSCIPNEIVEHVEANHFEPQGHIPSVTGNKYNKTTDVAKKLLEESEQDYVVWKGIKTGFRVDTMEGFMTFMEMSKHAPSATKYKDLLKRNIQDLVNWFHKEYMNCVFDAPMPPKIEGVEVCLFDLFEVVNGMGGSEQVSEKNQWDIVATRFGFQTCLKNKLRGIFERYLQLLDSFYMTVLEERTPKEQGSNEKVRKDSHTVGKIDKSDGVDGRNVNMAPGENGNKEGENEAQRTLMNEETDNL